MVDMTGMVCTMAAQYGITIAIEPLRKPECNVINTFEQGVDLARRVGMENGKVLVDYYHLTYEQESPSVLERWGKESLAHIHFANPAIGTLEECRFPNSPQEWPYEAFVSALQTIPYTGRISVEAYYRNSLDVQAPLTLRTMKKIFEGGNLQ